MPSKELSDAHTFSLFPHLEQKSIEGFIAQPAFMPKDNIIPVTLRKIVRDKMSKLKLASKYGSTA